MKTVGLQVGLLFAVAAVAVACGFGPTQTKWGDVGLQSLRAATVICLVAAVVAAVPLGIAAKWWPTYLAHAVFAGTAIRPLVTGSLAIAFQVFGDVHLKSFLLWLVVLYLSLMVAETAFGIVLVRRHLRMTVGGGE
ncbi:MAG: hypothetical protein IH988_03340 [Planctomycetes bacterium]|nr:hypothetical protein [Planctomycetota bacterium]